MKKITPFVIVFLYFVLATFYITYPLIFRLSDYIHGLGDELLITWVINWNINALFTDPLHIFNANIYYPFLYPLAYSDTFFTSSLLVLPFVKLIGEPVAAYNINLLFSFCFLGFFTYLFVYYLIRDHFASVISGTLVAFCTYTVTKTMHPQLIGMQWIPLSLLFFLWFIKEKKLKFFVLSCLFFFLQTANSFLPGYFLLFCFTVILGFYFVSKKENLEIFFSRQVFITLLITGFCITFIAIPYFRVSEEFHYVRDIRDTIHFANRLEYFFYASDRTWLKPYLDEIFYKYNKGPYFYDGYLGFSLLFLSFFSMWYFWKKYKSIKFYSISIPFLFIAFGSFILSLGPALQWGGKVIKIPFIIPLPYAIFYYLVPGFKGLRNSGRWEMLTVFALAVFIGLIFAYIFKKKSLRFKFFTTVVICFLTLAEFSFPYTYYQVKKKDAFPSVYTYIKNLPKNSAIIELPIYNWDMFPYANMEQTRIYYSTIHFKPMVNGGSGFSPLPWQEKVRDLMVNFPEEKTITYLKDIGITHIVIHKNEYNILAKNKFIVRGETMLNWKDLREELIKYADLYIVYETNEDIIYQIHRIK